MSETIDGAKEVKYQNKYITLQQTIKNCYVAFNIRYSDIESGIFVYRANLS